MSGSDPGLAALPACLCAVAVSVASADCVTSFQEDFYGAGDGPQSVAAADFDCDGDIDMAVANTFSSDVSILLNNGDGTFAGRSTVPLPIQPGLVTAGDLDNDGDADLALASSTADLQGAAAILLNNGDATFGPPVYQFVDFPALSTALGDLDGDGFLDLVVGMIWSPHLSIFFNNGDGTFGGDTPALVGGGEPTGPDLGDLDGDGDLDIAVDTGLNDVAVLLNDGVGGFADLTMYNAMEDPWYARLGDWEGDGDLDIAVYNWFSGTLSILRNNGDGTFAPQVYYVVGPGGGMIDVADLDVDGDLDIVVANGTVRVRLNDGNGVFNTFEILAAGSMNATVADLNGDGLPDLAMADVYADGVRVLLDPCIGIAGDLDGDDAVGILDLLTLLGDWGTCGSCSYSPCHADLNDDCTVGIADLLILLAAWSI